MDGPRLLIVEGNLAEVRSRQIALIGHDAGEGYIRVLKRLLPSATCDVIHPADGEVSLADGVGLSSYDGVVITGSALNVPQGGPAVTRQIDLVRSVFDAGVPLFGSCWGLQVAVAAAGGVVRVNPRGREFGFARRIQLTSIGRTHPMFVGKPDVFEAPAVHRDDIETLPRAARVLASNEMGLQAAEFSFGRGKFWGVQYHPEYGYVDVSAVTQRYAAALIGAGVFGDTAALEAFVVDMRRLDADPGNSALLWKHGLGAAMAQERLRTLEIANWLATQVSANTRETPR